MLFIYKDNSKALSSLLAAIVVSIGLSFSANCQSKKIVTIKGTVTDIQTEEPVASAHVYISQTKIGTTTNEKGEFKFRTELSGDQILVISFLGYKTIAKTIQLNESENELSFSIEMKPEQFDLEEVNVSTSNKEWVSNYEQFKKYFLGDNFFAQETSIENPWVINFRKDRFDNLIATAAKPINIKNHALGYNIEIDLVNFTLYNGGNASAYTYYSSFEEMTAENSSVSETWKSNRQNAYRGSFEHFLKSLYHENLWNNNFEVVYMGSNDSYTIDEFFKTTPDGQEQDQDVIKVYRLENPVDVLYGVRNSNFQQRQRSRITPQTDLGVFTVTKNGQLNNPRSLRVDGVWASHLIAHLLPIEYYKNQN